MLNLIQKKPDNLAINQFRRVPPAWNPGEITTFAWYDASDYSSLIESGGAVSQLGDKSGNDHHLIQPTLSAQPIITAGPGNRNMLAFNEDVMWTDADEFFPAGTVNYSMVIAWKRRDAANESFQFMQGIEASPGNNPRVFNNLGSWWTQGQSAYGQATGIVTSDGSPLVAAFVTRDLDVSYTNGDPAAIGRWSAYGNGVNTFQSSQWNPYSGYSYTPVGTQPLILGFNSKTVHSYNCTGDFYEMVCFDSAISTQLRQKLEGYLAWKWGFEAELPLLHPYRDEAPA